MKKLLLLSFFSVFAVGVFAQDFSIPDNPTLKDEEDYENYEELVIKCIDYLYDNPVNENGKKRLECIQFIIKWVEGAPLSVVITQDLVDIKEFELLLAYMGGYVKYAIENDTDSKEECMTYAANRELQMYEKNADYLKKGKVIKKFLKAKKKGELDSYIAERVVKD